MFFKSLVAQWLRRYTWNAKVKGSIPASIKKKKRTFCFAVIANRCDLKHLNLKLCCFKFARPVYPVS